MIYHVIYQSQTYEWILTAPLEGDKRKADCLSSISWQRTGGFYEIAYIATPVLEKLGVWKILEIHNVGHPKSNDRPRYSVGQEIRPVNNIYTKIAWQRMLERFWPQQAAMELV